MHAVRETQSLQYRTLMTVANITTIANSDQRHTAVEEEFI